MKKVCLIIDDKDQQHTFEAQIRDILAKDGYTVDAVLINTTSPEVLDEAQNIDIAKLTEHIKRKIDSRHIDVVATDFDLSDESVNGLDIIEIIRNIRSKVPIILYSGNLEKAIRSTIGDTTKKDADTLIKDVKKLMLHQISEFIDRTGYTSSVIKILKEKESVTRQILLKKLREYPDMIFLSAYPRFDGKRLAEIADEIEKSTYQGQDFQEELIEQTVAYMLKISEAE